MVRLIFFVIILIPKAQATGFCSFVGDSFAIGDSLENKSYYFSKAESAFNLRNFDKAVSFGELAIARAKANDTQQLIALYNLVGSSYTRLRSFDKAKASLDTALKLGLEKLDPNHFLIGDTYYYLAVYYDFTSRGKESLLHHELGLKIREQNLKISPLKVAESLNGIGEVYTFNFYNYRKAAYYYGESAKIREGHLEPHAYELYASYLNLSQAYRMLEDSDKALLYAHKALTVVKSRKEHFPLLEKCYILLAEIYAGKLEYSHAMDYFKKGMDHSISVSGPKNYRLIHIYIGLGLAYGELNELQMAIDCFRKSLSIYALHHNPEPNLQANSFLHIGRMFQKSGSYDSAKYFLRKNLSLRLSHHGSKNMRTSAAYSYLAKLFQEYKQVDSAAIYIQKALIASAEAFHNPSIHANPDISKIAEPYALFELFSDKGTILLDLYHERPNDLKVLTTSMECFKISDVLMELNRSAYHQDGAKLFFADHYHHIYESALEAAYVLFNKTQQRDHLADAATFMEKGKAILLAESLNKAEIFTSAGLPDSVREMEKNLNTALATYRSQLETVNQKPNSEAAERIQAQIFDISQKQERLLDTIARLYPNYFQVKYQKISSLSDIQNFAKENDATIIEYFWGEEKIYALAISGEELVFKQVTHADSLTQNIREYFQSIRQLPSWKENNLSFQNFFKSSHQIYKILVGPLLENSDNERIIIIRDGPLLHIPFESLPVSTANSQENSYQKLDYLMRHHTVSYAHSADLLIKGAGRPNDESTFSNVLGFSYSKLSSSANDIATSRAVSELPGAALEVQKISQMLPGSYYLGDDATEEKFKSQAGNFDILHLAVHGTSDPEKQFSGTLHFKQSPNGQEDGELHVYELYDLALKARLTVISACESGVGKIFRGEGVFSIARGFAYAGCPSTVMTLWPVSDLSSADIMANFYNSLSDGHHIDLALRTAKLDYLKTADPQLAHPFYWAAYIPTGNMEPVIRPPFPLKSMLLAVAVLIGLITYYILKNRAQAHTNRKDLASTTTLE